MGVLDSTPFGPNPEPRITMSRRKERFSCLFTILERMRRSDGRPKRGLLRSMPTKSLALRPRMNFDFPLGLSKPPGHRCKPKTCGSAPL